ncbi:unnamed protein product [Sphagnum jensenii]|uniref:FYVE-type domain-containing protein n=1 Tax=Sphagnum jensenii TaxID=128206 RepID=A0ABP0WIY3_9BRYO
MVLEKLGLPPKPSARGHSWTTDAANCEGCSSTFSLFNRKYYCRRCGGLFCNNCTQQRQVLRGQGEAPVRICEPCKKIEEATRFELRYAKNKNPKGGSRASSMSDADLLKQILGDDETSNNMSLEEILASAAGKDSGDHEVQSKESNEVYLEDEKEKDPISPEKLHQQADEEKKKYLVLKREGKNDEALKAFKRGKEMERQAEALEHLIKRNQRRAASASTSDIEQKSPGVQKSEPIGQKQRASSNELVKGKKASDDKDDYLKELKDLGWTDNDLHETGKKQSANEEELLLEIGGEMAPKPSRVAKSSAMQILSHKRRALALKREGNMAEAKEELRKAKVLEKQAEEMALLGQDDREGDDASDDELAALIRGLDKEEVLKGRAGVSQSIPEMLPNLLDDDDDANIEVDETDMEDPEMVAALRAMGWEEEALGLERNSATTAKVPRPAQVIEPSLKDQIVAHKRKALALKREGKTAEARVELSEAKQLEQRLEGMVHTRPAPVPEDPLPGVEDDGNETVEVTDDDMHDPEMMAALRAMGFAEDEPSAHALKMEVSPSPAEKVSLQQEILAIKRSALAMKREGRSAEARDELRQAKLLEQRLQTLQAEYQQQEETSAMLKESRAVRRGTQALQALSGSEEEMEDAQGDEGMDPDIIAALATVGWQETTQTSNSENPQIPIDEMKTMEPLVAVAEKPEVVKIKSKSQLQQELLGLKRRALALKREGKVEEAQVELQKAKILEKQIEDLETLEQSKSQPAVALPPEPTNKRSTKTHSSEGNREVASRLQDHAALPLFLDEEVDVTDDDMQDPELLAALQGLGWQGEQETSPASKHAIPQERTLLHPDLATAEQSESVRQAPRPEIKSVVTQAKGTVMEKNPKVTAGKGEMKIDVMQFDWGAPMWQVKKRGEAVPAKKHVKKEEENPFKGEYGEIGMAVGLEPEHAAPKVKAAAQKPHHFWRTEFMDLLSGDKWNPNQAAEGHTVMEELPQQKKPANQIDNDDNDEDAVVEDIFDPDLMSALQGLGIGPPQSGASNAMKMVATKGMRDSKLDSSQNMPSKVESSPTTVKMPEWAPPQTPSSSYHSEDVKAERKTSSANIGREKSSGTSKESLPQEILSHKRKALALKREGKQVEAREELRQAKLLEKQLDDHRADGLNNQEKTQSLVQVSNLASPTSSSGTSSESTRLKTQPEQSSASRTKNSLPVKGPTHKEQMQQQVRQGKDRMKLQQESLGHKRKALALRREGKTDEADAEFELAKSLEQQMEDLDPTHVHQDAGDVDGVEDLLDPQLLAALKGLGITGGELPGRNATKGSVPSGSKAPAVVAQPSGGSLKPKLGANAGSAKIIPVALDEQRQQLEERIRAEKVRALELKRAGKQAEALEMLRGAKRLEKELLSLASS